MFKKSLKSKSASSSTADLLADQKKSAEDKNTNTNPRTGDALKLAVQQAIERNQKLSKTEETAAQLENTSASLSLAASKLKEKFRKEAGVLSDENLPSTSSRNSISEKAKKATKETGKKSKKLFGKAMNKLKPTSSTSLLSQASNRSSTNLNILPTEQSFLQKQRTFCKKYSILIILTSVIILLVIIVLGLVFKR